MTDQQKLALIHRMARDYMGSRGRQSEPAFIANLLRKAHARMGFTPEDVEALP